MAKKIEASSDVYTAVLALATLAVLATVGYVAFMCWKYYGTMFSIV